MKQEDLAVIVADKKMEFTLKGVLERPERLGIRRITYKIEPHKEHDPGVVANGPETLALLRREFTHGLLLLDWEGSGVDSEKDVLELEAELDARLARVWGDRSKSIAIEPELETWMWGSDHVLAAVLGCEGLLIREWLGERGFVCDSNGKPARPKEAFESLLKHCRMPISSANFKNVVERISLAKCVDPSFGRLRETLRAWFPQTPSRS